MNKFTGFLLVLSVFAFDSSTSSETGNHVTPCKRYSEDLNQCIVNALEATRPNLAGGIPKRKIPPLDPFFLEEMIVNKTSEAIDLKANLTQLKLVGMSQVRFSRLNVDLADLTGSVDLEFSDLNVSTYYDIDALFMKMIPMKGQGQFNGTFRDVKVNMFVRAERSEQNKQGLSYLKINKTKMKIFIGDGKGRMMDTSKNQRNEVFTKTANSFFEHNRREVLDVLSPILEQFSEAPVQEMLNEMLTTAPYEEMFDG